MADDSQGENLKDKENELTPEDSVEGATLDLSSLHLDPSVAERLEDLYQSGKLIPCDLDDRALDALKEFPTEGAIAVLSQFSDSNLEHVSNKSAFLCGVMKTYRQKFRTSSLDPHSDSSLSDSPRGPDEEKIKAILDRTGYTLDVTTGQRKFGGPPPNWEGPPPGNGCEVFIGKIPRDIYEDELIPLFEKCGQIWDLRLMMDPLSGLNRGYAFVTFSDRKSALEAVQQLNGNVLGNGSLLQVNVSEPKTRLFVGNIPKSKGKEEIIDEFIKLSANLREVIIYSSPDDKKKNRGFCFLEYESHKAASLAKRRLETGRVKVWSCDIIVDWADPQEEPDENIMSQVKVLYVRNLTNNTTEEKLREAFEIYGKIERVKKIKDYAFIHFENREQSLKAMTALNGTDVCGSGLEISLAKPPSDKKKKEEVLRKREQRMMKSLGHCAPFPAFPPFPSSYGPGTLFSYGRGGCNVRGSGMRGGFHRGFDTPGWNWGWNESNWSPNQRSNGPPLETWMNSMNSWGGRGVTTHNGGGDNGYLINSGNGGGSGTGNRFHRHPPQRAGTYIR